MKKFYSILSRVTLGGLLLIALMPCLACGMADGGQAQKMESCPMHHSGGKADCCHHGKSSGAFCKGMNQSAVPAGQAPKVAVVSPVFYFFSPAAIMPAVLNVVVSSSSASPPKSLVLRI